MRKHGIGRWNYSEEAKKWVFVRQENGKRKYKYQIKTPKEFQELIKQLELLNNQLLHEKDPHKNKEIFEKMKKITKQLQNMKKIER
ncbi:MAG: hypothetical protein BAJALOKI1v1_610013 [Promethearchaeota archaeon]|nr:MAG: hypothetical protein BAJALOKI1v1_610013 [Candidatus Lokiarchaeota archaeon]